MTRGGAHAPTRAAAAAAVPRRRPASARAQHRRRASAAAVAASPFVALAGATAAALAAAAVPAFATAAFMAPSGAGEGEGEEEVEQQEERAARREQIASMRQPPGGGGGGGVLLPLSQSAQQLRAMKQRPASASAAVRPLVGAAPWGKSRGHAAAAARSAFPTTSTSCAPGGGSLLPTTGMRGQRRQRVQVTRQPLHEQLKPLRDPDFLAPVPTLTRRRGLHTRKMPLVSRSCGFFDAVEACLDWGGDEDELRRLKRERERESSGGGGGGGAAAPSSRALAAYIDAVHRQV